MVTIGSSREGVHAAQIRVGDVAYMGIYPSRANEVEFTRPFMQQNFTDLVPAGLLSATSPTRVSAAFASQWLAITSPPWRSVAS